MPAYIPPAPKPAKPRASSGGGGGGKAPKPKQPALPPTFNTNWEARAAVLKAAGYHPKAINAAIQYDYHGVLAGKKPFTNSQAYASAHALATGKDIFKRVTSGGGLISNITNTLSSGLHDVEDIAVSLSPQNLARGYYHGSIGALATTARLGGEAFGLYGHKSGARTGVTSALDDLFSHIPDYNHERKQRDAMYQHINHRVAKGDLGGGLSEGFQLPGMQLVPGTFTASALAKGDPGQLAKHPVITLLDLLPAETAGAKALSTGVSAARYSAREAFQQGKFLRGVTRAVAGTSKIKPTSSARAVEAAAAHDLTRIPRTSEAITRAAEHFGVSHLQRDLYEHLNVAGRKLQKAGTEARDAQMRTFARDIPEAEQTRLYDAVTSGDPAKLRALSPELQGRAAILRDMRDTAAVNELLPRGFVGMEFNGKTYYYHPSSPVGKARAEVTKARQAYGKELERIQTRLEASKVRLEKEVQRSRARAEALEAEHAASMSSPYALAPHEAVAMGKVGSAIRTKRSQLVLTDPKVQTRMRVVEERQAKLDHLAVSRRATDVVRAEKKLAVRFHDNPPREFHPAAYAKAQQRAESALKEQRFTAGRIDQATYEHALESLHNNTPESLWADNIVSKQEWTKWVKQAGASWQRMAARQGFDPIYVPNAATSQIESMFSTRPLMDTGAFTPGQFKNAKLTQFRPEVGHVALQMSKADLDHLHGAMQAESLDFITHAHALDYATIRRMEQMQTGGSDLKLKQILNDKYYAWNPTSGLKTGTLSKAWQNGDLFVPKAAYDALESYLKQYGGKGGISGNLIGVYDKGTRFFRVAVTATPRHLVHVAATGVTRALGEQGLSWIPQLHAAWNLAHEGIPEMGSNISAGALTADEGRAFLEGRVKASALVDHLSKVPGVNGAKAAFDWYRNMEEHVGQTLKYSSMLAAEKKGLRAGLGAEDARMQAIAEANRIHMNLDRMSPFERNVVRRIFPFYGFTSELLRYMFQYPADHPVAAAAISRIALMEQQDNSTGLPQMFHSYFQTVGPMKPDGTQSFISARALNPFRSLGNGQSPFTLAGLTSALNPYIQSGLRIAGVDPLNASTNPYQEQQIDPFTGGAVSVHTGWAGTTLDTFLPQGKLLTDYVAAVPGLNQLKLTDPKAYRTSVFTALGIPSEMVVPFQKNLYDERIKLQLRYLSQAQKKIYTLIKSGDYEAMKQYDYLPYKSQILTPDQLVQQLKAGTP